MNNHIEMSTMDDHELDATDGGFWGAVATVAALAYVAYDIYQGWTKYEPSTPYVYSTISYE
jgi:hypothetical protein